MFLEYYFNSENNVLSNFKKKNVLYCVMTTRRSQNCSRANINTAIHSHQTSTPWHSFQHFAIFYRPFSVLEAFDSSNMSKKRKNLKKRVQFHRKSGVFELRPGNMLYAFCVNAGGHLEHLYWGEDIGESESLSYLQSSNVKIAFQTEAPPIDLSRQRGICSTIIEREK